jgi:ArsR family transcriptional regulator
MDVASGLLRVLADPMRLRLLRVLAREALNVSELTAVLGLAQSGVSRHLGLLRKAGLVVEERKGAFAWYRLAPEADNGPHAPLWRWLRTEFERASPETRADDGRLEEVRRLRKESFLQHGGADDARQFVPGRSWAAWSRALALLLPAADVADLGCGEGYLTIEAAAWARQVYGVDRSGAVLARAKAMATRRKVTNIDWRRGELEDVPLDDESIDVVMLSQALHHAQKPEMALAEANRILRPGGRVVLLDLDEHDETWVKSTLGDQWLGFAPDRLQALLTGAGFSDVTIRTGASRPGDPFTVLVASATKKPGFRKHRGNPVSLTRKDRGNPVSLTGKDHGTPVSLTRKRRGNPVS